MNCMMIGHYDRYIVLDCGLMFPECAPDTWSGPNATRGILSGLYRRQAASLRAWNFAPPVFLRRRVSSSQQVLSEAPSSPPSVP